MTQKILFSLFSIFIFQSCLQNSNHKTDVQGIEQQDSIEIITDSDSLNFPQRELDEYVIARDTFNTLGRNVRYSRYKFFDTGLKGYPKLTLIDVFEFNDTAISVGTDGEFSKIILNTPDRFDIIQLHGNTTYSLDLQECLKKSLCIIAQSDNLPKARYKYDTVIDEMKEKQWVSHFKKEIVRTILLLKNLDGYSIEFAFRPRILTKNQTENMYGYYNSIDNNRPLGKEESDSLSKEALKRLPPFLFGNWEEYAVPFYRYGYAPIP